MTDGAATSRWTDYAELHGCSCKLGRGDLEAMLAEAGLDSPTDREDVRFGVGEDAAAVEVGPDLAMVQTVDFFTPIVDDPYEYGRVAACNALSDVYATGATESPSFLVVLGVPRELTGEAPALLAGVHDVLAGVDGAIVGGHTTLNPWPLAGGAVTAPVDPDDLLRTAGASPGDRLLLTKPLGTQPAMGARRVQEGEFAETVADATAVDVAAIADAALAWMTTPNRDAARAARGLATAATDVTGFGLLGQARLLAANAAVGVELTHLPVIEGTMPLSDLFGYGLGAGESAETSGGLLLSVPSARHEELAATLADAAVFHREVGRVVAGSDARLVDPTIEEIPVD